MGIWEEKLQMGGRGDAKYLGQKQCQVCLRSRCDWGRFRTGWLVGKELREEWELEPNELGHGALWSRQCERLWGKKCEQVSQALCLWTPGGGHAGLVCPDPGSSVQTPCSSAGCLADPGPHHLLSLWANTVEDLCDVVTTKQKKTLGVGFCKLQYLLFFSLSLVTASCVILEMLHYVSCSLAVNNKDNYCRICMAMK